MEESNKEKLVFLREVINRSRYMVCLFGVGIGSQCGCTNYRDEDDSYDIEEKYGYSPDEMFNVTFFNTRVDRFYDFYKKDMINNLGTVGEGLYCLKRLEEQGKLKSIITRDIFSLPEEPDARMFMSCTEVYTGISVRTAAGNIRWSTYKTAGESPDVNPAAV